MATKQNGNGLHSQTETDATSENKSLDKLNQCGYTGTKSEAQADDEPGPGFIGRTGKRASVEAEAAR